MSFFSGRKYIASLAGASALALFIAQAAHAASADGPVSADASSDAGAAPDADPGDSSRDIVVTAQHREEKLQDVPTAVTALDKNLFAQGGVGRSANEVLSLVPNASAGTQQHGRPRW